MKAEAEDFRPQRPAVSSRLARRAAITVLGVAVYRACLQISIAGVDSGVIAEFFSGSEKSVHTVGLFVSSVRLDFLASMSSHSIGQYLGASSLVLLLSGALPWLKRLRDGGRGSRVQLDRVIIAFAAVLVGWQAWQRSLWLESIQGPSSALPLVPGPGWGFRLLAVTTLVGGAMVVIWVAHLITHKGIGNGVAIIVASDILALVPSLASEEWRRLNAGLVAPRQVLYGAIAILAVLTLAIAMVTAARQIPLRRRDQAPGDPSSRPEGSRPLALPLRVQAVGMTPILTAQSFVFLAGYMAQTLGIGGGRTLATDSYLYWATYVALILLLTYLYAFITFSPRDAVSRMRRYGYCVDGAATDGDARRLVRDAHLRIIFFGGLYLGVTVALPVVLVHALRVGPQLGALCGIKMVILAAVGVDVMAQVRAEIVLQKSCGQGGDSSPWVQVLTAQTRLETEMAQALLEERGIESMPVANRVTSATGTLAFWEASRPRFPCLTIHRGLGGGQAQLMVPPGAADQACRALEEMGIASE